MFLQFEMKLLTFRSSLCNEKMFPPLSHVAMIFFPVYPHVIRYNVTFGPKTGLR